MGQLEDIQVFLRVVEAGGISRAAEQLNIAKSAVSRRLAELEDRLQTKLIQRTTRQFHLTDSGQRYYRQALQVVNSVKSLNASVTDSSNGLEGKLRVSLPLSFAVLHLTDVLDRFIKQHPNLALQIDLSDHELNLVESGIDVALRIGELSDSTIQARKIVPIDFVICASSELLDKQGEPKCLEDLDDKPFIQYQSSVGQAIEVTSPDGHKSLLHLKGSLQSNNGEVLAALAVKGHGYVVMPRFICWRELQSGQLKTVLNDYKLPSMNAYAIYPQNRFLSPAARQFIDFLVDYFSENRPWQAV